jgi:hypothetical protein
MAKQSFTDRLERLLDGRCPVHGISFTQTEPYKYLIDDKEACIASCPRKDCEISVYTYGPEPDDIIGLLPEYQEVLGISVEEFQNFKNQPKRLLHHKSQLE